MQIPEETGGTQKYKKKIQQTTSPKEDCDMWFKAYKISTSRIRNEL